MSGYNGQMHPTDKIKHEQMTVMIMNAYKHLKEEAVSDVSILYTDADDISSWAIMAVAEADTLGITDDQSLKFEPKEDATRAEAAVLVFMYKFRSKRPYFGHSHTHMGYSSLIRKGLKSLDYTIHCGWSTQT